MPQTHLLLSSACRPSLNAHPKVSTGPPGSNGSACSSMHMHTQRSSSFDLQGVSNIRPLSGLHPSPVSLSSRTQSDLQALRPGM
ncbi:hypothetical protein Q7C36_017869 [Tachysurus vachellii]|uniref:Uncharacterized protein n=1 Tax=Tachysurus vachellii TaxID=175792 RepID=A0AA88LZX8_TACVA|nr:hypothetical protein Q7C36_017869 [Tachysurus vachellii]